MNKSSVFNLNKYYQLYYRRTYLFAKSYVHDQWIAEDIASDALVKLWELMAKNEINHPLTFLFTIVKNKSIDYLRHEIVRQEALASMSDTGLRELNTRISTLEAFEPNSIYSDEIKKIVNDTLNSLPEKTREIFLMSRYQELSKIEIADKLNITSKGVEYHITKALRSLHISLKDYFPIFYFFFIYQ